MTTTKARRTYSATLAMFAPTALAVALALPAMTYDAPDAGFHGLESADRWTDVPVNVAEWDADVAAAFPACERNTGETLTDVVIVLDEHADASRISFDAAYALVQDDEAANDVWIIGVCPSR